MIVIITAGYLFTWLLADIIRRRRRHRRSDRRGHRRTRGSSDAGAASSSAAAERLRQGVQLSDDIAEMATDLNTTQLLFSESNTRFIVETTPANADEFQQLLRSADVPVRRLGTMINDEQLVVTSNERVVLQVNLEDAKAAWKKPLDWS